MRLMVFCLGWVFVALGVIGLFLPLLPTTPFMIVAATLFARSSPRFEKWLLDHPRFGQPLTDWRKHGAISTRAKILAVSMMVVSLGIMWFFSSAPLFVRIGTAVILAASATFVLTRPAPQHDAHQSPSDSRANE
jgi:uncharacterized protein